MLLILVLMSAIVCGCVTAANYEDGRVILTFAWALATAALFTYYMMGIQS